MAPVADFIKFQDAPERVAWEKSHQSTMRRVNVRAIAQYLALTDSKQEGLTKVVLMGGDRLYTRHTPEQIDKAIAKQGHVVSV